MLDNIVGPSMNSNINTGYSTCLGPSNSWATHSCPIHLVALLPTGMKGTAQQLIFTPS